MSDASLLVLDGSQLRTGDFSLPGSSDVIAGVSLLELADSRVSDYLHGLSLPENFKSSALRLLDVDFGDQKLEREKAQRFLRDYVTAIADQLRDDPLVVSVLDGSSILVFFEDEDDFAMLAENLFTELDIEDEGKLSKSEVRSALVFMGPGMGVPPLADFPVINDILNKHGAEGEGKLGQSQFAQLLQPVLQDLADALALKPITVVQNIKIINGLKLRKLLANEKQLNDVIENVYQQKHDSEKAQTERIRIYLEKNGEELGLPPSEASDAAILLYDSIFSVISKENNDIELEKNKLASLVKRILEKFAEKLQEDPIFHEPTIESC